jgi:hypothetical protein
LRSRQAICSEVVGAKDLQLTRMEYDQIDRQFYSIDNYRLRDGLRAVIVEIERG